jgi:hypothetical protein
MPVLRGWRQNGSPNAPTALNPAFHIRAVHSRAIWQRNAMTSMLEKFWRIGILGN